MPIFMVHYPSKMILDGIIALNAEQENRLYLIRKNVAFLAPFLFGFLVSCTWEGDFGENIGVIQGFPQV